MGDSNTTQPELRPAVEGAFRLKLRSRVEVFKGSGECDELSVERAFPVAKTAVLLCDVWDAHWCKSAARRCGEMAPRMNEVVKVAREKGLQIIHSPSDTLGFYANTPERLRAQLAPMVAPPEPKQLPDPPLPIDDSDNGCDDVPQCPIYGAWSRQDASIEITGYDAISDSGEEVYRLLHQLGIENLIVMGVHTNMCVIGRSFGLKQMTRWGIRCVLVRDLTDTMYNPRKAPYVSHEEGTELVVRHIEQHWCPTALSNDLLDGLA